MNFLKKNSTVVILLAALIVIVVVGFWFKKPTLTDTKGETSDVKKKKPNAPTEKDQQSPVTTTK